MSYNLSFTCVGTSDPVWVLWFIEWITRYYPWIMVDTPNTCRWGDWKKTTISELSIAVFQLACLAIFSSACQSCEYLKVPATEQWQTTIIWLQNIRFFRNGKLINQNDTEIEFSSIATCWPLKNKRKQKYWHCHTNGFGWCYTLSCLCSSSYHLTNQRISRQDSRYPHFCKSW